MQHKTKKLIRVGCPKCSGSGYSPFAQVMSARWYGQVVFSPADKGSQPFSPDCMAIVQVARDNVSRDPTHYRLPDPGAPTNAKYVIDPQKAKYAIEAEACRLASLFNTQWCHHLDEGDVKALIDAGRLRELTHDWKPIQTEGIKHIRGTWVPRMRYKHKPIPDINLTKPVAFGGDLSFEIELDIPTPLQVNIWSLSGIGHDSINSHICVKAECQKLGKELGCQWCDGTGEVPKGRFK